MHIGNKMYINLFFDLCVVTMGIVASALNVEGVSIEVDFIGWIFTGWESCFCGVTFGICGVMSPCCISTLGNNPSESLDSFSSPVACIVKLTQIQQ